MKIGCKKRTKESAIEEYRAIRKKYGDKAQSSGWIYQNGYSRLYDYVSGHFKSWNDFKNEAGFANESLMTHWTKKKAIQEYQEIRKKHGDEAKKGLWLSNNGCSGLRGYISEHFKNWNDFKKQAGFKEEPLQENWTKKKIIKEYHNIRGKHSGAKSSSWLQENKYGYLLAVIRKYFGSFDEFKKEAGFDEKPLHIIWTKEKAIKEYTKIRKENGKRAKSCRWLLDNGYRGLYGYIKKHYEYWNDFKKEAGFNEEPLHQSWTKEKAIKEYVKIRGQHGDKAKSKAWLDDNYMGLGAYISNHFRWNNFKRQAGFNEEPLHQSWTKEKAIKEYREIRKKYGDKAKSYSWLEKNSYRSLLRHISERLQLKWRDFKRLAGFDEEPLNESWNKEKLIKKYLGIRKQHGEKAGNSRWLESNGYGRLIGAIRRYFGSFNYFKKEAGFDEEPLHESWTIKKIIKKYRELREKYGDKAKSSAWLEKNGYSGLYAAIGKYFDNFNDFKKQAGFSEEPLHESWTKEKLIKEYDKIINKHGSNAQKTHWLVLNGYCGVYQYVLRLFKSWQNFLDFYNYSYRMSEKELRIV